MDLIEKLLEKIGRMERQIARLERREGGGGGGGVTDHGALTGLGDDDHTQYYNAARHTKAVHDALNINADTVDGSHASAFAPAAQGVTNGNSHDHSGGDGNQIDHTGLSNLNSSSYYHLTQAQHTDLTDGGETTLHSHAGAGTITRYAADGRLTLESGVPVSTSDQAGKTTLYYTPFEGDRIALYNGSGWETLAFSELSISLSGLTASRPYDVFCYNNSGTATLELLAWTNASTRATALTTQNGVLVKSGAATRRYLGTICINASGGQTDDTTIARLVWNYYHRRARRLYVTEQTSHTYNGAYRLWNNSETNNRLEFMIGVAEDAAQYLANPAIKAGADGSSARTHLYIDGSATGFVMSNYNNQYIICSTAVIDLPAAGLHYLNLMEYGDHASSTFVHMRLSAQVSG